jgi:hypothetical protein
MIDVYPNPMPSDTSAFVIFRGIPLMNITWTLTGDGALTQADSRTDARGVAKAIFTPSSPDQTVLVEVTYGG